MLDLDQNLVAALHELPFLGDKVDIKSIQQQGLSNSAYQLTCQGKRYFLKVLDSNHFVQLEREQLFKLQNELANRSLAPNAIYLDPQERFQVDEWIDGKTLSESSIAIKDKLTALATTMAAIHNVRITLPELNLRRDWLSYYNTIGVTVDKGICAQIDVYDVRYQATNEKVLCHNDLALVHCHAERQKMTYDWEYAAIGNRFYDLASCIDVNQLNEEEMRSFLQTYFDESQGVDTLSPYSHSELIHNVEEMMPLVLMTNSLWLKASQSGTLE